MATSILQNFKIVFNRLHFRHYLSLGFILFLIIPTHYQIKTQAIAVARHIAYASAETNGTVAQVFVRTGDWVRPGTPLLQLYSPQLEAELSAAEAADSLARLQSAQYNQSEKPQEQAQIPATNLLLKGAWAHLNALRQDYDRTTLRAPIAGQVTTPQIEKLLGAFAPEGTPLVQISDTHTLELLIPLLESEASIISYQAPIYGQWVGSAEAFETTLEDLPLRKALANEYSHAFSTRYGGPAPQQNMQGETADTVDEALYPIFLAQAPLPGSIQGIQPQMRAQIVIQGKRTLMALRIWQAIRALMN